MIKNKKNGTKNSIQCRATVEELTQVLGKFYVHFRPLEIFGMKNKPTTEFIFRMICPKGWH